MDVGSTLNTESERYARFLILIEIGFIKFRLASRTFGLELTPKGLELKPKAWNLPCVSLQFPIKVAAAAALAAALAAAGRRSR